MSSNEIFHPLKMSSIKVLSFGVNVYEHAIPEKIEFSLEAGYFSKILQDDTNWIMNVLLQLECEVKASEGKLYALTYCVEAEISLDKKTENEIKEEEFEVYALPTILNSMIATARAQIMSFTSMMKIPVIEIPVINLKAFINNCRMPIPQEQENE